LEGSNTPTNNQLTKHSKMSATIMMPQQIDNAIKEMCGDAMSQAVSVLAEKYGFDVEEANRFLDISTLKVVRKRGSASSKDNKSKTSPRTKKDDGDKPKVKRGKTGYLLFADEVRSEIKSELTAELEEGEKLKPQDVVRGIAAKWKAVDQGVRDEWNAKAKTPVTSDDESETKDKTVPDAPKKKKETKSKNESASNSDADDEDD
jgi:hypothetical protein